MASSFEQPPAEIQVQRYPSFVWFHWNVDENACRSADPSRFVETRAYIYIYIYICVCVCVCVCV